MKPIFIYKYRLGLNQECSRKSSYFQFLKTRFTHNIEERAFRLLTGQFFVPYPKVMLTFLTAPWKLMIPLSNRVHYFVVTV